MRIHSVLRMNKVSEAVTFKHNIHSQWKGHAHSAEEAGSSPLSPDCTHWCPFHTPE